MHVLFEREESRALQQVASAMPAMPGDGSAEHRDPDQIVVDALKTFLHAVADNPLTWRLILLPVEGTPRSLRDHVKRTRRVAAA